MERIMTADIDLIEELRLRRWARENYVSAERRESAWHPVVLDEMKSKERDQSTVFATTA
ncbi:MAG: hypothetical protein K1X57_02295 [Gemmataceae bacterium]|nr:hypothetical protein [Gemmataceae bacterium]